jgi:hypothetical protein
VAHSGREEAKKKWHAMRVDPEFQEVIKSEQANKLVEKVDLPYMRPTDFSPIKWCEIWHSAILIGQPGTTNTRRRMNL